MREAETIRGLDDEQEVAECRQRLPQHASQLFRLPRDWRAACSWSYPVASPDADCCPKHDVLPTPPTPSSTSLSTASLAHCLILSSPSAAAFLDAVLLHGELIPAPNMIPSRPQEVQVLLLVCIPHIPAKPTWEIGSKWARETYGAPHVVSPHPDLMPNDIRHRCPSSSSALSQARPKPRPLETTPHPPQSALLCLSTPLCS